MTSACITTELHHTIVFHQPRIWFAAFRADHIILNITLDHHFDEGDLKFSIENGAVSIDFSGCAQLTKQEFHQMILITADLARNLREVSVSYTHLTLPTN